MIRKIFILGLMCLASGCSSLLYYPSSEKYFDPAKVQLTPEDVYFKDNHDRKIHGWFFRCLTKKCLGTVVFFHGNAENISSHFVNLYWLPKAGYSYLIFDYPGYGESEGSPSPEATVDSGQAALRYVHKEKDQRDLIVYGHSLGGIVALRAVLDLKNEMNFRSVIIDSSFDSYQGIAKDVASKHWFLWPLQPLTSLLFSDDYAPQNMAEISPTPLLFIYGEKDNVVDPKFSQAMFAKAKEPKQIWAIPNSGHPDSFWVEQGKYRQKVLDYLLEL